METNITDMKNTGNAVDTAEKHDGTLYCTADGDVFTDEHEAREHASTLSDHTIRLATAEEVNAETQRMISNWHEQMEELLEGLNEVPEGDIY